MSNDLKEVDIKILENIKCFIFDLDGTVYLDDELLDGSIEFLNLLDENNIKFKFFTNNSSQNVKFYRSKIRNMCYDLTDDMMLISNHVIIDYIKRNINDKSIFVLGNEYLLEDFIESGIKVVSDNPHIVVVGFDTLLSYENVTKACDFIRDGAIFFGDRLYIDIAIGRWNNSKTILVLSGETDAEDLEISDIQPDLVFASLKEFKNIFNEEKNN